MKCNEINIRDPFVVVKDGKYYMYGTRAASFGQSTGGFDVYVSDDLENWSEPHECFNSETYGMNVNVNWAPEVHEYKGAYYMFATFTRKSNGLRGTFILKADSLMGPFVPHSKGQATPEEWECLDGTLYVSPDGVPYIVFCHEHTQILDGTICYTRLSDDLTEAVGETVTLFRASEVEGVDEAGGPGHYVTDGPFLYRTKAGELLMIWSSFMRGNYAEYVVKFKDGKLGRDFEHMAPLDTSDGGHGMIFGGLDGRLYFTFHAPNQSLWERPHFVELEDMGDRIAVKN